MTNNNIIIEPTNKKNFIDNDSDLGLIDKTDFTNKKQNDIKKNNIDHSVIDALRRTILFATPIYAFKDTTITHFGFDDASLSTPNASKANISLEQK
ncbi:putative ORFan [Tupanvirus deep ocean]|uniref:ORFan n=2 Tax=Tupanvirus TaxID=2094720 RepID=A0AC62A8U1_9VIRU|nr:putative ORFan [Tupanvirus deep ocean]QKU34172.1 putative ORFan [Tupanvirus deep ocean]